MTAMREKHTRTNTEHYTHVESWSMLHWRRDSFSA